MSVVSAPSGAGRSPYNSEPSIEVREATSRLGRIKPETSANTRDTRSPIRTTTGERVANGHVNSVGHCRGADRGKLPEETVEFTTARPATVTGVMATYPSLRANRTHTFDYIPGNTWKSKQCVEDFETRLARPNPRYPASLLHGNSACK
jgi:hypothetical protein